MVDQPTGEQPNAPSNQGLVDLNTTQQQGVRNLGGIIQAIRTTFPGQFVGVPANSTASGQPNQVSFDTGFLYVCIGVNTWRRVAISSF